MECAFHNQNKDIILLSVVCVERFSILEWNMWIRFVCEPRAKPQFILNDCVHVSVSYAYKNRNWPEMSDGISTEHGRKMIKITIDYNNNK